MANIIDETQLSLVRKGRIICNSTVCTGCRTCEAVCSLFHEGVVNTELSRIQIETWEYEGWRSERFMCVSNAKMRSV